MCVPLAGGGGRDDGGRVLPLSYRHCALTVSRAPRTKQGSRSEGDAKSSEGDFFRADLSPPRPFFRARFRVLAIVFRLPPIIRLSTYYILTIFILELLSYKILTPLDFYYLIIPLNIFLSLLLLSLLLAIDPILKALVAIVINNLLNLFIYYIYIYFTYILYSTLITSIDI